MQPSANRSRRAFPSQARRHRPLAGLLCAVALAGCGSGATGESAGHLSSGSGASALTAAECSYFDVQGSVRICHATGSSKNPYTILQLSDAGCINGHTSHPNDYVATATDLNCKGGGCFPVGAPTDPRIACCPGLIVRNGVCTDACAGVTCTASDQCQQPASATRPRASARTRRPRTASRAWMAIRTRSATSAPRASAPASTTASA